VTSKHLSTERLKLIMKLSQEVIRAMKLKIGFLILASLTSGRRQLRTKSVNLMPNSRELIKERINGRITLVKKLLQTNINKKSIVSCGLIETAKKCPYLMRPLKLYNLSRKSILHTSHKNQTSSSILIKPSLVCTKLRLIRSHTIIIINKEHLLLTSTSLLRNHWLSRSQRRWQTGKLFSEKIPQSKTAHVPTHLRNTVMIVGAIEKHQTSQHWDGA
jgi:hypothetical protein